MPRGARLDEPEAPHHVIARVIERAEIVVDDDVWIDFRLDWEEVQDAEQ